MTLVEKIDRQFKVISKSDIKKRYEDKTVVSEYISKRFKKPVGKMKHDIQVRILNRLIALTRPKTVLELACGPARLTTDIEGKFKGVATDYSDEMLKLAKERTKSKNWAFKKMDAFKPNLGNQKFDFIFGFRFIRHFNSSKRKELYSNIKKLLSKDGTLVFDVVNAKKGKWVKLAGGKKRQITYDKLYRRDDFLTEVEENGFKVISMYPVVNHFFTQYGASELTSKLMPKLGYKIVNRLETFGRRKNPWEWVVVCKKK